jgi:hypothetical protein
MAGPGFVGARITKNNIGGVNEQIRQAISKAMQNGCERILTDAAADAPRATGELAESGRVAQTGLLTFFVIFGEELPDARAVYQEYGTARMPASPYLVPAIDQETPSIVADIAAAAGGRVLHTDVRVAEISRVEDA